MDTKVFACEEKGDKKSLASVRWKLLLKGWYNDTNTKQLQYVGNVAITHPYAVNFHREMLNVQYLYVDTFHSHYFCHLLHKFKTAQNLSQLKQVTIGQWALTFRHSASSIWDRPFATLQRTLFIYLINKYISLSDICLTVHHWYK